MGLSCSQAQYQYRQLRCLVRDTPRMNAVSLYISMLSEYYRTSAKILVISSASLHHSLSWAPSSDMVQQTHSHLVIGAALTYILVSLASHGINFLQLPE